MHLTAELNDNTYQVKCHRDGGRVIAEVDGRAYDLAVRDVEKHAYLLIADGRVFECRVDDSEPRHESLVVHLGSDEFEITLVDSRRLRGSINPHVLAGDGSAEITSPMAGKVVRVLVEQGAQVKAGDGIVVVEAMKMQNELKSPYDGVVNEIRAKPGSTVSAGEVLAIIA